jgi:hypothetical protein
VLLLSTKKIKKNPFDVTINKDKHRIRLSLRVEPLFTPPTAA